MPGNPVVHGIAQGPRYPVKDMQKAPGFAQLAQEFKRSVRAGKDPVAIDQHDGIEYRAIELKPGQQLLSRLRLKRCKPDAACAVALQNPLHRGIAQVTNPVEQQYWKFMLRFHQRFCFLHPQNAAFARYCTKTASVLP